MLSSPDAPDLIRAENVGGRDGGNGNSGTSRNGAGAGAVVAAEAIVTAGVSAGAGAGAGAGADWAEIGTRRILDVSDGDVVSADVL